MRPIFYLITFNDLRLTINGYSGETAIGPKSTSTPGPPSSEIPHACAAGSCPWMRLKS